MGEAPILPPDLLVSAFQERPERFKNRRLVGNLEENGHHRIVTIMNRIPMVSNENDPSKEDLFMVVKQFEIEGQGGFFTFAEASNGEQRFIGISPIPANKAKLIAAEAMRQKEMQFSEDQVELTFLDVAENNSGIFSYQFTIARDVRTLVTVEPDGNIRSLNGRKNVW